MSRSLDITKVPALVHFLHRKTVADATAQKHVSSLPCGSEIGQVGFWPQVGDKAPQLGPNLDNDIFADSAHVF